MSKRRVVVTGLGMVTPLGLNVEDTWRATLAGQSGVVLIENEKITSAYPSRICATVKNFDPTLYMQAKEARRIDTFVQFGIAAAKEAMRDSGLEITEQNSSRIGVAIGSGIGGLPWIEKTHTTLVEGGPRKVSPFFIPGAIINMISGYVSILHGLRGPNIALVSACSTGSHNIGYSARTIAYGDADVMVAGGAEMSSSPLTFSGFSALKALSTRNDAPEQASRPWDKDRDGFVLGEGAGIIILEEYEHAKKRGAKIYAELAGFGMSGDAYHITAPDSEGRGAIASMQNSLNDAYANAEEIDYINAHGTSTPMGDQLEALAIEQAFGEHAKKLAVSSTKSMIGHLLGAAGAVEAIYCILALRDQIAPPTINLDNPDIGCNLDFIPHTAREMKIQVALSNSFGFGGTNATLLFRQM